MANEFKISLADKPNLSKALGENPALAKEVIKTFVDLIEESFDPDKGTTWAELPKELHQDLSFSMLIKGILRGSLDLKGINPDAYDVLKAEVHPLAFLSPRKNAVDGGMRVYNWREHFKLPKDAAVSEATVSDIFRKLLRYSRYVKIEDLARALESNQLTTFRGLGERSVALLPMIPALQFQRKHFGELHVGKFHDEVGALDCGSIEYAVTRCSACKHDTELHIISRYKVCLVCNAGYKLQKEPDNE